MSALSTIFDNNVMQTITSEFTRLGDKTYLENAGATLYPGSLVRSVNEDLLNNFYMNPHTDKYTRDCIEQIRCVILNHFNTNPEEYTIVFTSGTTNSLKLVVESFQFASDENEVLNCGSFMYLRDNHTSVLGLREIAADKNADVIHISHSDFLQTLSPIHTTSSWKERYQNEGNTLFVYPAQSNFNGYKYPIDCMGQIKDGCLNTYIKKHLCKVNCNWYILLDAASFVATNKLDLSKSKPDFVALSFYKIFGFPTGLGALLIKNSSENILSQKRYFGGGTVDIVLSSEDFHVKRQTFHEKFEDGTQPFLSIIALKHCFDTFHRLLPKVINNDLMDTISYHTFYLAQDLYQQLINLHHRNGKQVAILYMDSEFDDIKIQGAVITFNIMREDGSYVGYSEFQHMADLFNISVRTGCFCNSGSCQRHLNVTNNEMKDMYKAGHKCGDEIDLINGMPTGAIRVSFGYYNTFNDIDKLMHMICQCYVKTKYKKPKRFFDANKTKEKTNKIYDGVQKEHGSSEVFFRDIPIPNLLNVDTKLTLKSMAIFPIKSCGALKISSAWKIGPKGFEYDREWMIIKENGVCLTQKHSTKMCMIRPTIDFKQKFLMLNFKGMDPCYVPLEQENLNHQHISICQSKICTDVVQVYDCGDEVADWISNALEIAFLRLIRQSSGDKRAQKKKTEGDEKLLSLSNQAQFLLINQATVKWLHSKISDSLFTDDINRLTDRFRGNLIIDMDKELIERDWQRIIIGKHEFKVEGQCNRCQMVCIDQETGEKTVEPLRTIAEQFGGKMRFGIYLSYIGTIDGSKDRILKTNSPIRPFTNDDDISRFTEWFYMCYLSNFSCPCELLYKYKKNRKDKRKIKNNNMIKQGISDMNL